MLDWQCLLRWGLVGILLFIGKSWDYRRPSHRFGGKTMRNICLSLESSYIPVRIRRRVLERDNYECVWCGEPEEHNVSHFIQKQAGGETSCYNLVTTCKNCKQKRHYDSPKEFISKLALKELDVFQEMEMRIKIIKYDGNEIEVEVESRPDLNNVQGFWITYLGNGTQEWIWAKDIKKLTVLRGTKKK